MTFRDCRACLLSRRDQGPTLAYLASQMATFDSLEAAIRRTVADDGTIPDSASDTLARCRREQRTIQGRLRERLEELVRGPLARMLQDPLITMRGERYVVPVRQEYRGEFPGVLHDQSASGATAFMEPLVLVPLGNQLRALEAAARDEIAKLLLALSAQVAAEAEPIAYALDALGVMDFAIAKALLSQEMDAVSPGIRTDGVLRLLRARHPLLRGEVVPIDISLGEEFTTLVVTGPNTGGKTVTLKTVGLLTLMAQAGLHLPAADGSEITVFPQVLADIGDEQSIEQSLSTFSSHMGAIVAILRQVRGPALVLLDEIGAGTDPTEGVALARALIEYLHAQGVRTIVTTHYNELKALAYLHPGIQNASVEFDIQTLRPTYRVLIGVPGRSNALTIASRLGLDEAIVDQAKTFLSPHEVAIDKVLSDIEADRRAYEWELSEAATQRRAAEAARARYEQELEKVREGRKKILAQAREEAKALLERTRREIASLLDTFKSAARPAALQEAQQRLREVAEPWAEPPLEVPLGEGLTEVHPGQQVFVVPLNVTGTVRSDPDARGEVEVESGVLRVRVSVGALRSVSAPQVESPGTPTESAIGAPSDVAVSIDVRGQTVDEAIPAVDHYLDDAVRAGLPQVTIIHGKGMGILRQAVGEFLRRHPNVKTFRLGERGEGKTGVTVVELKG
jgi:DNA mismatch repair protein MutS2